MGPQPMGVKALRLRWRMLTQGRPICCDNHQSAACRNADAVTSGQVFPIGAAVENSDNAIRSCGLIVPCLNGGVERGKNQIGKRREFFTYCYLPTFRIIEWFRTIVWIGKPIAAIVRASA